jgi:hypothetical protein
MIKIQIERNGTITNEATFETEAEGQEWLSRHESMGTFGQKAQTIDQQVETTPAVLDENNEEIVPAKFETQTVELAGYKVIIEDLTAQLELEAQKAEALKFLQDTDYKVLKHRDQTEMGRTPDMSVEEFQYLLTQRQQARDKI